MSRIQDEPPLQRIRTLAGVLRQAPRLQHPWLAEVAQALDGVRQTADLIIEALDEIESKGEQLTSEEPPYT